MDKTGLSNERSFKDLIEPKDEWGKLSMREKAAMIEVGVRNGMTSMNDIRSAYNEFAEGGNINDKYYSKMEQIAEENYKDWGFNSPEEALAHVLNDNTYDYNGYYRNNPTSSANAVTHWPDTYKTVYHPTFSDESLYSGQKSQYNPQGLPGGFWSGETFIPRAWQLHQNRYASGGGIHIKPSHRGRLTELKKRTGKTEAELYRTGGPAVRKMITFARSARKWKHGDGGNLFEEAGKMQIGLNVPKIGLDVQGWPSYTTEQIVANGEKVQQQRKAIQDAYLNFVTESNDATAVANGRPQNQHLAERAIEGAKAHAAWEKEHPILTAWSYAPTMAVLGAANAPLAGAAWEGLTALGTAAASTTIGQALSSALSPITTAATTTLPYVNTSLINLGNVGLTSWFGAEGINRAIEEKGISPITALDIAPMLQIAKPMYRAGKAFVDPAAEWAMGYRATPKVTAENAASYTPKVNWDADNWFKTISGRGSYSSEEAAELASHVPEYRNIERRLFNEGKLVSDADGSIIVKDSDMSPQEYIMRQSEAFQKMNLEHHYMGVSKGKVDSFENGNYHDFDAWTTRTNPKDVEEYAISPEGGYTFDSQIEDIQHQMMIREDNFNLHKEKLQWKLDHSKISQEQYDRDMKSLTEMFEWKQQTAKDELAQLTKQKQIDPLNGGKVYDITYPLSAKEAPVIDAQGAHWQHVPYDNSGNLITTSTDHIVSANKGLGYDVTTINNVMDTHNGVNLNESIIHRGTPIKSVLGNTGAFDITGPNKYKRFRGLIPWIGGLSTLGIGSSMLIEDNYYSR